MNKFSFEIRSSKDFFEKLKLDYEDFQNDILSSRLAINCALTAWHLTDWIFVEHNEKLKYSDLGTFRSSLKCGSLLLMHDIANGSKHFKLKWPKSNISRTNLHYGEFSSDFSLEFNVSCLTITLDSGEEKYFEKEIEEVIAFWESYFNKVIGNL